MGAPVLRTGGRYVRTLMKAALPLELRGIADRLNESVENGSSAAVTEPLDHLERSATEIAKAWSGSSFGFHARIYYADLAPPPPGAHFSAEWGFEGTFQGTTGDWREYNHDEVLNEIRARAGHPNVTEAESLSEAARRSFNEAQADAASLVRAFLSTRPDEFLASIAEDIEKTVALTKAQAMQAQLPRGGNLMSRDSTAIMQGLHVAPHQEILAEVVSIRSPFTACNNLRTAILRASAHIERLTEMPSAQPLKQGDAVFIGHGQSLLWRELKDFIQDRLKLPWEEFNRVPVAGITNITRLSQMLDAAGIAFLLLTAEDEVAEGVVRARQNVVHEAGLFQGRLGFQRAIVLLEEGCEEFSNIHGLGQVRFPRNNISATFEEVRRVLEREGFLDEM